MGLGNFILSTPTPALDTLLKQGRATLLRTASLEIGLPWGSVGDSELGHYNLGTGRIVVRRGTRAPTLTSVLEREELLFNDSSPNIVSYNANRLIRRPLALKSPICLGSALAAAGYTQVKIGHQNKKAALTEAMNGFPKTPITGEAFVSLPDEPALATLVTQNPALFEPDLVVVNLSLADRLAHTGDLAAVRTAITITDKNLAFLAAQAAAHRAVLYVTADHGNIEQMVNAYDHPDGQHSTNPVALIRVDLVKPRTALNFIHQPRQKIKLATTMPTGLLADVAPTILEELGLLIPNAMVGISLRRFLIKPSES